MWNRFQERLRCVACGSRLTLKPLAERKASLTPQQFERADRQGLTVEQVIGAVDQGLLLCEECFTWYPIYHGLPVMLPYWTNLHDSFLGENGSHVQGLGSKYKAMRDKPAPGEDFVRKSFSSEWLDYTYDGVIWSYTLEDRRKFFLAELGAPKTKSYKDFLEIGCGLGLVTNFASEEYECDAVGVDLSLAAMRAAQHFRENPFLHFVQASVFRLPFEKHSFDLVYSHGVLHHTYSTAEAFRHMAARCRNDGRLYVWLYGEGTKTARLDRRIAYAVECVVRPVMARSPGWIQSVALAPFSALYAVINRTQRMFGKPLEPYTYQRALHAVRDRLTPLYAHRHSVNEVRSWFEKCGFESLHLVQPCEVPASAVDNIVCGVGMQGQCATEVDGTCAAS